MPRHDPTLPGSDRTRKAWRRYRQLMSWMAIAAVVAVLLALIYLKSSGDPVSMHMVIATALGVGLSVLLGTALMGLVFLSNSSGHDEQASGKGEKDDFS
jgi:RsiW-degrading membrane proteinase PrsW (M82 family)